MFPVPLLSSNRFMSPEKKNHSTQRVRERLGKVISLSEDKKSGVFLSPTRGLVEFDAVSGTFSPVSDTAKETSYSELFPKPQIHTVFGDVFLLLRFLEKHGLLSVFQSVFPKKKGILILRKDISIIQVYKYK